MPLREVGVAAQCPRCAARRALRIIKDRYGEYAMCLSCGWHGYRDSQRPRTAKAPPGGPHAPEAEHLNRAS